MSYQVLARKYRPASFEELEGQEHVLRALVNALENDRLHHAYLFTGTRGVGKTTIARILARCLNCEKGVSARPCGECSTCREIAEGRSVDLIEVDAASRTKVEDTRELLDNVQYLPTHNRFKIYLIDEVHMLSTHSFNALLKTLEEPPEHVKFLLATTDPKKLPVTVLSRCLQFNLKNLSPERIVSYLQQILPVEGIEFDEPALWLLGRAADGSMRDALSLTDQAISFGNNAVKEDDVKLMLGSIDQREVYELLDGLIKQDAAQVMEKVAGLAEHAPDYSGLLAELLGVLHRVAMAQAVPKGIDNSQGDKALVQSVASALSPEDVQLFYQIGLVGQRDLPFAPNLRTGFEMILLRMLAFTPFAVEEGDSNTAVSVDSPQKKTLEFEPPEANRGGGSEISALLSSLKAPEAAANPPEAVQRSAPVASKTPATSVSTTTPGPAPAPRSSGSSSAMSAAPVAAGPLSARVIETDPNAEEDELIDFGEAEPVVAKATVVDADKSRAADASAPENRAPENSAPENRAPKVTIPEAKTPASKPAVKAPSESQSSEQSHASSEDVSKSEAASEPDNCQPEHRLPEKPPPEERVQSKPAQVAGSGGASDKLALNPDTWVDVLPHLGLSGVTQSVASNCQLVSSGPDCCKLVLAESQASLANKNHETRIQNALGQYYGCDYKLEFEVGTVSGETPAQIEAQRREAARVAAVKLIEADPKVQQLIENFGGKLDLDTITARQ